jgi:RNA polymerase sigma-70 factor, ECF subfamily
MDGMTISTPAEAARPLASDGRSGTWSSASMVSMDLPALADRREQEAEESLLAALRAGDEQAYHELVAGHGGRLLAVCRRFLGNEEDARDALQDAFFHAFRALPRFAGHCRIGTWLHRIAVNTALMKLRSRRSKPEEPIEPLLPTFVEDGHQTTPAADWLEPFELLLRRENCERVRQSIAALPTTYRTVLLLRDIEELGTAEVGELLGISQNAVKIRLHRARQALRELLDPHFRKATV